MRKYETKIETTSREVLIELTCDLCKGVGKYGGWESSTYEINEVEVEVTVRQQDGTSCPEGGWGTELKVDICPKCFDTRIMPLFKKEFKIEELNLG